MRKSAYGTRVKETEEARGILQEAYGIDLPQLAGQIPWATLGDWPTPLTEARIDGVRQVEQPRVVLCCKVNDQPGVFPDGETFPPSSTGTFDGLGGTIIVEDARVAQFSASDFQFI